MLSTSKLVLAKANGFGVAPEGAARAGDTLAHLRVHAASCPQSPLVGLSQSWPGGQHSDSAAAPCPWGDGPPISATATGGNAMVRATKATIMARTSFIAFQA